VRKSFRIRKQIDIDLTQQDKQMNRGFQQMFDLIFPDVIRTFCTCERCTSMTPPRVFVRSGSGGSNNNNPCLLSVAATHVTTFATLRIAARFDMTPVNPANILPADLIAGIAALEEGLEDQLPHDECILDHRVIVLLAQVCDEANPSSGRPPSPSHHMDSHTPRDFFGHRTDVAMIATLLPVMAM
jgi:hypothetical protein